jgi:ferredoxin-type protein NapH
MHTLQKFGMALFLLAVALLIAIPFIGQYRLTPQIVEEVVTDTGQLDYIRPEVEEMFGKTYTSKFAFISDLDDAFSTSSTKIQDYNQIDNREVEVNNLEDYVAGQYKFYLTRKATTGTIREHTGLWLLLTIGLGVLGAFLYILPKLGLLPGIKNDHIFHSQNTGLGWIGYTIGTLLILFYVLLYWYPEYITEWMVLTDPISKSISGNEASQWFFYGLLYTLAILVMGIRMIIKYRHSRYHIIRTLSLMFFQTAFAFMIPEILIRLNQPYFDFKNIWPLNYNFFFDYNITQFLSSGNLGIFMFVWGILLIIVAVPLFSYFYGKRWYCSWVCGCGGLAETLGDPYRQLSDKSLKAWKIERWMIHGVLVFAVVMTVGVLYTFFTGSGSFLFIDTYSLRTVYGFLIGAAFAGVIGVGFYPLMGNRVWCRFGCPLAAYIGLVQRFKSRFRITTNGGQCISCGNCSTYCEMGIDVRWYAQRGQNIIRSSCVGCGVCASVCPRGVLKLENGKEEGRFGQAILIGNNSAQIYSDIDYIK